MTWARARAAIRPRSSIFVLSIAKQSASVTSPGSNSLKSLWEKRLKISLYAEANEPFELIPGDRSTKAGRRAIDRELQRLHGATTGVLCFSEVWTTSVMWAHYAERHAGMCLGFDVPLASATKISYIAEPFAPGSKLSKRDLAAVLTVKPAT